MTHEDAVALIAGMSHGAPATWADLGCGDGTFTLALATLLPPRSVIHAMDQDASLLRRIPRTHDGTSIVTHAGDFTAMPWPFGPVDGVLLANALHYVRDRAAFIRACEEAMNSPRRFLIVEYDTDRSNPWVPYPVGREALRLTLRELGYGSVRILGSRPSMYQRAPLYAAAIERVVPL
jgi:ubiquinone/menaquinone biosynthesis C-methylase UbiE